MGGEQPSQTEWRGRGPGKVDSLLNEKLEGVEWGDFNLYELFNVKRGQRLVSSNRVAGDRPLITAGFNNSGVACFISNIEQEVFPPKTITVDMFGNVFYRDYEYSADDNILILSINDKNNINKSSGLFISSIIRKTLSSKYDYAKQYRLSDFNKTRIKLPVKDGSIDFNFMESFVAELEAERIAELEAYLDVAGLNDYELTNDEMKLIQEWEAGLSQNNFLEGGSILKSFRVSDIFNASTAKGFDEGKMEIIEMDKPEHCEFVGRTKENNGVKGYLKRMAISPNPNGVISVSQIGTINSQLRKRQWYASQNIFILKPIEEQNFSLFSICAINKALEGTFSGGYSNYPTLARLRDLDIYYPVKGEAVDHKFIATLTSAIKKLVIMDVVEYAERNSRAYREIKGISIGQESYFQEPRSCDGFLQPGNRFYQPSER